MNLTIQDFTKRKFSLLKAAKNKPILSIVIITWIAMWLSINTKPENVYQIFNSPIQFINGIRFLGSIILSIISLLLIVYLFIQKKIKKFSITFILFGLYFTTHLFGLIDTIDRSLSLDNIYLIILSFGTISSLIILDNYYNQKIVNFFFVFSILILFSGYMISVLGADADIVSESLKKGNLYLLFHPEVEIFYQSSPRITGFGRALALTAIALMSVLLILKRNKKIDLLIFFILIFFSCLIWLGQSRGAILCYYLTSIILIFFLNQLNIFKKLLLFVSITFFSIFITQTYLKISYDQSPVYLDDNKLNELNKLEEKKDEANDFKIRLLDSEHGSSGRFDLWSKAIEKYDKSKIFGYGSQGDRHVLYIYSNKWSNNSSNSIIYSLLSGGYVGVVLIILFYIFILNILLNFVVEKKILKKKYNIEKKNLIYTISILFIIFFSIRSIFENSFGVFSVDFLFMILCTYIAEKNKKKFI